MRSKLPLAAVLLIAATLCALFVMTGSLLLPIKALIMNALTLAATLGMLVVVFQDGNLEGLLSFESERGAPHRVAVLVVVAGFGLSTDYGVFSLSRMREIHDGGATNEEAVALGAERTGRLITSAALLFAVAMGALVTGSLIGVKEHRPRLGAGRPDRRDDRPRPAGTVADGDARRPQLVGAEVPPRAHSRAREVASRSPGPRARE